MVMRVLILSATLVVEHWLRGLQGSSILVVRPSSVRARAPAVPYGVESQSQGDHHALAGHMKRSLSHPTLGCGASLS